MELRLTKGNHSKTHLNPIESKRNVGMLNCQRACRNWKMMMRGGSGAQQKGCYFPWDTFPKLVEAHRIQEETKGHFRQFSGCLLKQSTPQVLNRYKNYRNEHLQLERVVNNLNNHSRKMDELDPPGSSQPKEA